MNGTSRPTGPGEFTIVAVMLFGLGAYTVVAGSSSGSENLVAIGVFAFVLFVVGIAWPCIALSRFAVTASVAPDATVGDDVTVRVEITGRVRRLEVRILDPNGRWRYATAPSRGELTHVASRRGVFSYLRIEARTSAPLGVFVRRKRFMVALPVDVHIAPRAIASPAVLATVPELETTTTSTRAVGPGDTVRTVRPYVAGDPARLVHWPTSARQGSLVVREYEPPAVLGVALVVDLRGPSEAAESAAARAMGIGRATLAAGGVVLLCTAERDGSVCELVADARALGRRLARAVGGEPPQPPKGWAVEEVRA